MRPSLPRNLRRLSALLMGSALLAGSIQTATAADPTYRVDPSQLRPTKDQPARSAAPSSVTSGRLPRRTARSPSSSSFPRSPSPRTAAAWRASPRRTLRRGVQTSINLKATNTVRYRSYLKTKQDAFTKQLSADVTGSKVTGHFDIVLNAVSAIVPKDQLSTIAKMPGVAAVYPDVIRHALTDASPPSSGRRPSGRTSVARRAPARA